MPKAIGNDFEDSRRIQQPPSSRNTKARRVAKPIEGQPKEGPQRYTDEREAPTVGRVADGVATPRQVT